jgi:hypothetical protein
MRELFWCLAILQNEISSLKVLLTLSSLHCWKEMALGNRESHQLLAAERGMKFAGLKPLWVIRTNARQ